VSRDVLRGVITNDIIEALQKHNQAKSKMLIKQMGTKYLCHPDNYVKRKDGKVYK
jgi:Ni2+-binding GTPase involved in maturation of urease and hydrogenase